MGELLKAVEPEYEIDHIDELTDIEKKAIDEGISDAESRKSTFEFGSKPTG